MKEVTIVDNYKGCRQYNIKINIKLNVKQGFSDSSVDKESVCNAGDPSSIPEQGRSPGEGIGYAFQYSWASLVAQLGKNMPAMPETWVQSLCWEDPLEKEKATHSSIQAQRIPWTIVHGVPKSRIRLSDFHFHFFLGHMKLVHFPEYLLDINNQKILEKAFLVRKKYLLTIPQSAKKIINFNYF